MALATDIDVKDALGGSFASVADEALAQMFRPIAERFVKSYVGYAIEQKTFTEYYPMGAVRDPGDPLIEIFEMQGGRVTAWSRDYARNRVLQVRNLPLRSIVSIHENPAAWDISATPDFSDAFKLSQGSHYIGDWESPGLSWTGLIYKQAGTWHPKPRTVQVVYVAGLTSAELEKSSGDYPEFFAATVQTTVKLFNEYKAQQGQADGSGSTGPVSSERLLDWSVSYVASVQALNQGFMRGLPVGAARILHERIRIGKHLGI